MVLVSALTALLLAASTSAPGPAEAASLVLDFPDLKPQGQVTVALFANDTAWRGRKQAVRTAQIQLADAGAQARFEGLAPGVYGVMAYHDRNANGRLDTLPIGLPVEPYGFSNNARATFGPPAWRAARFTAGPGQTVQQIRLR